MHLSLPSVPLFEGLPEETLATLADITAERRLARGEALFEEGDTGDEAYVVLEGEVRIVKEVAVGLQRADQRRLGAAGISEQRALGLIAHGAIGAEQGAGKIGHVGGVRVHGVITGPVCPRRKQETSEAV